IYVEEISQSISRQIYSRRRRFYVSKQSIAHARPTWWSTAGLVWNQRSGWEIRLSLLLLRCYLSSELAGDVSLQKPSEIFDVTTPSQDTDGRVHILFQY